MVPMKKGHRRSTTFTGSKANRRYYWTPEQSKAIREFVERADSLAINLPSVQELVRQAMAELVPGTVGQRSEHAVQHKIRTIRDDDDKRDHLRWSTWTAAHKLALREFVQREKAAAGKETLTLIEIARRAMAQLVPGVLGPRTKGAVLKKIKIMQAK